MCIQSFLRSSAIVTAMVFAGCQSGGVAGSRTGKVNMALTSDLDTAANVHVMVTAVADGAVSVDQTLTLEASSSLDLSFDVQSGDSILDIEITDASGATLQGSGSAELDVSAGGTLSLAISLAASAAASAEASASTSGEVATGAEAGAEAQGEAGAEASGEAGIDAGAGAQGEAGGEASGSASGEASGEASGSASGEASVDVSASSDDDEDDDDDSSASVSVTIELSL